MAYPFYSSFLKLPVPHIHTGQEYFLGILIFQSTCPTSHIHTGQELFFLGILIFQIAIPHIHTGE